MCNYVSTHKNTMVYNQNFFGGRRGGGWGGGSSEGCLKWGGGGGGLLRIFAKTSKNRGWVKAEVVHRGRVSPPLPPGKF